MNYENESKRCEYKRVLKFYYTTDHNQLQVFHNEPNILQEIDHLE